MKKLVAIVSAVTIVSGILLPTTVKADDEALAAVGGFLGGLVVGSIIADSSRPCYSYYYEPVPVYHVSAPRYTTTVIYHQRPVYYRRYKTYVYPTYISTTTVEECWY